MMKEQDLLAEMLEAEKVARLLIKSKELKEANAKKALDLLGRLQLQLDRSEVVKIVKTTHKVNM